MKHIVLQINDRKKPGYIGIAARLDPTHIIKEYAENGIMVKGFELFDGKRVSTTLVYGFRWAGTNDVGYPKAYGRAEWMILPDELGQTVEAVEMLKGNLPTPMQR